MTDLVHAVFRVLHMVGGFLAFAAAPLALLAVKGSQRHILAGRFFTIGMGMAAASAILLSVMRPQYRGVVLIFALYVRILPRPAQWLVPVVLGIPAIMWARRQFGPRPPRAAREPNAVP